MLSVPASRQLALPILVVACFLGFAGQASAATQRLWSGLGGNALWSNPGNWVGGVAPVAGDGVTFSGGARATTDDIAAAITNIVFTSTAGGSVVSGTVNINAATVTINIDSESDGNRIDAPIAISGSNLFVKSGVAGQKLTLGGVMSGGPMLGVRIYGPGIVEYAMAGNNTYPGVTQVASNDSNGSAGILQLNSSSAAALVPADLTIGTSSSPGPANSAQVRLLSRDSIADTSHVAVSSDGLLDLNNLNETVGSVTDGGNITQGSGALTVNNGVVVNGGSITSTGAPLLLTSSATVTGNALATAAVITSPIRVSAAAPFTLPVIVGGGPTQPALVLNGITANAGPTVSVSKSGAGTLQLGGTSTYTGTTNVTLGTLALNGSLLSSAVNVSGGTALQGLGTSGAVAVTGGAFAPGLPGLHGTYAMSGGLALDGASAFNLDVAGAGAGGYDAASATGPITLGDSALHLNVAPGFVAPPHATLRIVDNLGSGPIGGTFLGLPENAPVLLGGQVFRLSYAAGTGNDVELHLPNAAPLLATGASASPSPGAAGIPLTLSAAAADPDSDPLTYTWSFGDGTTGTGATTTHAYRTPGQYAVSVAITDGFGGSLSSSTSVTVIAAPGSATPVLTHFAQTHAKWRAGSALAVFAKTTKRAPVGTQLSFTLNEPATVSLAFTQSVTGRRSGAHCVAQTKKNRKAKSCKRTLAAGTLKHSARTGKNTVTFQARISSANKLKPGRYTVTATAANTAGQRSKPSSLSFTIVK